MFFPLRTDRRLIHKPWVNMTLVCVCTVIFLAQIIYGRGAAPWYAQFELNPLRPEIYQFFSYQFLHQSWEHLIFNMIFLYVFGNSLEDRFGPLGYLAFYLAGGVVAGMGHCMVSSSVVLGASGSISAVTGAFLALFPRSNVTIVFWLLIVDFFEVPSMWLILLSFGQDLFFQVVGSEARVAYVAHLTGNLFGFILGMALLATRILPREPYDFVALLDRWRRRRMLATMAVEGQSPWLSEAMTAPVGAQLPDDRLARIGELRSQITAALVVQQPQKALDLYGDLLNIEPLQVMPKQTQLDLANYAINDGRYRLAARSYDLFLRTYPNDEFCDQVRLMLGLIYARYLGEPDLARPLLKTAAASITDPARQRMAQDALADIGA
jgi:membrane associated rhomboid family serine protease